MKPKSISATVCPEGMTIDEWQSELRRRAADKGQFIIHELPDRNVPGAFAVTSPKSQRKYRVLYHGSDSQWNSCDCMDFRTSGLGTCKHIEAVAAWLAKKKRKPDSRMPRNSALDVSYTQGRRIRLRLWSGASPELAMAAMRYFDDNNLADPGMVAELPTFIEQAKRLDPRFHCSADALNMILESRDRRRRLQIADALTDADIDACTKVHLLPYQRRGVEFAFRAGRCLIADQMGLGKTIQAIATAQLLKNLNMAGSALILCPTSLKYQWKKEIERFTDEEVTIVEGIHTRRRELYAAPGFYKIVSYHTLANDLKALGALRIDMLIMDEVQRLKNWNTQISQAARKIESEYAVVLSGTPLENKLEELYSVMQFVDQYALGPYHRFLNSSVVIGDNGKVTGYRQLHDIAERLRPWMIRRTKNEVSLQLPERRDQNLFVAMTEQQTAIHDEAQSIVAQLAQKWKRQSFLSEKDRKRLMLNLSAMRMVCDSTYILDQHTRYGNKVPEVMHIVENAVADGDKLVIFSQWERMTRLVAEELEKAGIGFEYLHGGVPAAKRAAMTERFAADNDCRVFLSTDAGSTGLNLQSASIVINIDLPWNPAVLEQRVARIHRIGQRRNIQVINLVSAGTIEERMLSVLNFKRNLFEGVFDGGDDRITLDDNKLNRITNAVSAIFDDDDADNGTDSTHGQAENTESDTGAAASEAAPASVPAGTPAPAKEKAGESGQASSTSERNTASEVVKTASQFVSSLAGILSQPGGAKALADELVHTDADGNSTIRIPVDSKDTVVRLLSALSGMINGGK